jgi:hypothetical protein
MSPRCVMLMRQFLLIAVPFTVVCWGGFWLVRQHWCAVAWEPGDRRLFRWLLVCCAIILAELTVLVCVATNRSRPSRGAGMTPTAEARAIAR